MTPAKREEIYRKLAAAMPDPKSELEFTTPFELLVAVVLSAQALASNLNQSALKVQDLRNQANQAIATNVDAVMRSIAGTARSMGVETDL